MANSIIINFANFQKIRPIAINPNASVAEWIKLLKLLSTETIHRSYLHYKYELSSAVELNFLFNESHWQEAQNVLDIGFGPGFPIGNKKPFFPNKRYDLLALHLDPAEGSHHPSTLVSSEEKPVSGGYDAIFLREIITNTKGFVQLTESMFPHLKKGGHIISLEPVNNYQQFHPELPQLKKYLEERPFGSPHNHLQRKNQEMGIDIVKTERRDVHVMNQAEKQLAFHKYLLLPELILRKTGVEYNQTSLCEELRSWNLNVHATIQFQVDFLVFSPHKGKEKRDERISTH